jgi:hypothetical protein
MLTCHGGSRFFLIIFEAPTQTHYSCEKNNGTKSDEARVQARQPISLMEINQTVYDGDDVVYTKDERIEHTGTTQLQAAMHIVELGQGENDQSNQDHPRLPAVELVVTVYDGSDEELDGALGDQERVGRQYAADTAKEHAAYQA